MYKGIQKTIGLLVCFLASASLVNADAGFTINEVRSLIDLRNSNVEVSEIISVNITDPMYGLERFIPDKYSNGFKAGVNLLNARNGEGVDLVLREYYGNGNVIAQMITPGREYVSGDYTFILDYEVTNIFSKSKFEWNVNGTETNVPSDKVVAEVFYDPNEFDDSSVNCVAGLYGSDDKDCTIQIVEPGHVISTATNLEPFENLTIFVGGSLTLIEQLKIWAYIYWPYLIPILVFLFMFFRWKKHGRDDASLKDTVVPHYDPPEGFDPVLAGTLYDFIVDPRDLTSLIIARAVAGDLRIIEKGRNDYELELLKEMQFQNAYEVSFFTKIFPTNKQGTKVSLKSLQYKLGAIKSVLDKGVISVLIERKMLKSNPKTTRAMYLSVAGFVVFAMFFIFNSGIFVSFKWTFVFVSSSLFIAGFGYSCLLELQLVRSISSNLKDCMNI